MGLGGLEPPTSRLSGVRSNQLSYRPTPRCIAAESSPLGRPHSLAPVLLRIGARTWPNSEGTTMPDRQAGQTHPTTSSRKERE